jgi:hypothetical protein
MEYIINSKVPPESLFILSAIVSARVSDSIVWICLNGVLPVFSYALSSLDSLLAEDNIYSTNTAISTIPVKLNCWCINVFSLCYSLPAYGWYLIPVCVLYNTLCDSTNNTGVCTKVSLGLAVLKLSYKTWIVIPLTYNVWKKYEERKKVNVESYEYKSLTWELHAIVAALLIFASYFV